MDKSLIFRFRISQVGGREIIFFFASESFSRKFFLTHSNVLADIFEQCSEK